jgi:hypothetical protein
MGLHEIKKLGVRMWGEMAQIMYTHVSKCNNNKIKLKIEKFNKSIIYLDKSKCGGDKREKERRLKKIRNEEEGI